MFLLIAPEPFPLQLAFIACFLCLGWSDACIACLHCCVLQVLAHGGPADDGATASPAVTPSHAGGVAAEGASAFDFAQSPVLASAYDLGAAAGSENPRHHYAVIKDSGTSGVVATTALRAQGPYAQPLRPADVEVTCS